ncbi:MULTISPECIES: LamG-like jellyroll fold domain-containing protein [Okeania]|uniref:LamG domain-containing protein n=1 Tax=Okeania hirsuta TaxID=1458930 RepID=A0A3N6PRJ4_9CYAN|nr:MULTISPECIES: LamG-like jellyroll fold domain-containing protein [Okeania]NES79215.1 hypothetical protein [Okeania sp. SIO1H4]NES88244.1 hypothetical protein [Okeania sp. SIO2B9]NET22593.1 hypothetical protein [Okeania sp. SIO1H5]NET79241.1 hypothetical protein [Okeania sp. SIO1F9]NET95743.1 hypothetical protein [Okeania sp. SIO1H2]
MDLSGEHTSTNNDFEYSGWHHYAYLYNDDTKKGETYRDGVRVDREEVNNNHHSTGAFKIGTRANHYFRGLICEMRVWNYARSEGETQRDMYQPLIGNEEGLMNYWPMNEGTGDTINDRQSFRNCNGTLSGNNKPEWETDSGPDGFGEPVRYAKPGSIQSSQSAAAYLKHIYDLAREQISPSLEKWALDTRRPDLQNLELSENNLHEEITTLELVNEVLLSMLCSCLHFPGNDGYVRVPNTDNQMKVFNDQSFTVECWAKVEEGNSTSRMMLFSESGGGLVRAGFFDDKLFFALDNGTQRCPDIYEYTNWHHYAFVFNNENKKQEIYRDGVQVYERTWDNICGVSAALKIGTYGSNDQYFPGMIKEMRIWNYARFGQEIQENMYCPLVGNEDGLMNYWPMNEGTGETIYDRTSRGCHGSFSGSNSNKPQWVIDKNFGGQFSDDGQIFNQLKTQLHPLALPFNKDLATVRTGLAQIEGMNVNAIARRFQEDDYALTQESFTLIPHITDALDLVESEIEKLQQNTSDNDNLFTQIFGVFTKSELQYVDTFIEATNITFDEFRQLSRDYAVKDEAGTSYSQNEWGARFHMGTYKVLILEEENERLRMRGDDDDNIHTNQLSGMNHLVRLKKRTGLEFHQLDQLLCSVKDASDNRRVTDKGFNVLAHYLYWQEQYNLSVDQFVGMLQEVNCYVRVGEQTEPTLMRQLFGKDAPYVTEKILASSIKLTELENLKEGGITLGDPATRIETHSSGMGCSFGVS